MSEATPQGASIQERIESLLAAEEAPTTQEQPAAEEPAQDLQGDDREASPDVEPEQAAADEEAGADDGEQDEATEDGETLEVSALAQYLGIDADRLDVGDNGELLIKTKVDGEEGRAKLSDLLKSYQLEGHLNKKNMEVAEAHKALQTKLEEADRITSEKAQHLEDALKVAQNRLLAEFQAVNWQDLRANDPAEYAARLADYQQRNAEIQNDLSAVAMERQQLSIRQQGKIQQHLAEQARMLPELIPEWKDEAAAAKGKQEVTEYIRSFGYGDEAIAGITDAAQIAIIRKAMLYDQLQKAKPGVEKRVKTAPKLSKPGAAKSTQERQSAELQGIRKLVKKSGGKQGVIEYLLASGKA